MAEWRIAEAWSRGPQPVWKLSGAGSVGSQSMLGIARLERLRHDVRFAEHIAIWPFETGFELDLSRPIIVAEIYPTLVDPAPGVTPKDRAQVEAIVSRFAELDAAGLLQDALAAPPGLSDEQRQAILAEEGWIAGVGVSLLRSPCRRTCCRRPRAFRACRRLRQGSGDHLRPELLCHPCRGRSFGIAALVPIAIRMIHACGMDDLAADIVGDPLIGDAVETGISNHAPILCDSEMVRAGIQQRHLRGNDLIVTLNDPAVEPLAERLGTTRSAAAVELWREHLNGAVVVIGNAPTALFHLLDMIAAGAARPAAIIATPVGFVGAAESKDWLIAEAPVPFVTVRGRRGGSAIASAAFNAIAGARA